MGEKLGPKFDIFETLDETDERVGMITDVTGRMMRGDQKELTPENRQNSMEKMGWTDDEVSMMEDGFKKMGEGMREMEKSFEEFLGDKEEGKKMKGEDGKMNKESKEMFSDKMLDQVKSECEEDCERKDRHMESLKDMTRGRKKTDEEKEMDKEMKDKKE